VEAKVEQKTAPKPALTTKQEVKQEVKQEIVEAKQEVKKEIAAVAKDPATLYKACTTCHGADAGKSALNKSQIIKGWSAQKIADALNGYKDGTYGGASKALMKGQVAKLSKEDIESLSNYIAKF
jgi:cytochrome c553